MSTRFAQVTRLTAVAVAAAAVLAACSPGGAGDSSGLATVTTTGTPTTAAPTSSAVQADPVARPRYKDVTGQNDNLELDNGTPPAQLGSPAPGIKIHRGPRDAGEMCTLGPAVTAESGLSAFLTAGHCWEYKGVRESQLAQVGSGVYRPLGPVEGVDGQLLEKDPYALGYIISDEAVGDFVIGGNWPVKRVMSAEEVQGLDPGTPICVNGAVAQIRCGSFIRADAEAVKFEPITNEGDSGAPVFVVDENDTAILIGVVAGLAEYEDDPSTRESAATLLGPTVDAGVFTPITDPAAAP